MALTEQQREIALRVTQEIMPGKGTMILCDEDMLDFAARFLAALPKPEPMRTAAMLDQWFLAKSGIDPTTPIYTEAPIAPPASDYEKLIAQLKYPEIHFPGNFDTVKRANAILMCLCQEAADALSEKSPPASEQKPDLRTFCISDENTFMKTLADRIVGNATPEEDSRLDVAYAIARHLKLDWPSAYEAHIAPPASEQKPIAWLTTNEDGDYAMLFFDKQEALIYSGDDGPIGLAPVSSSAPQPDYKAQRDALLKCLALIEPKLDFSGWENGQGEDIGNEINAAIASVKGGA